MTEATRLLTLSEAGARRQAKLRPAPTVTTGRGGGKQPRFPPGLEWEILGADAVVLLGLTNALGYVPFPVLFFVPFPCSRRCSPSLLSSGSFSPSLVFASTIMTAY